MIIGLAQMHIAWENKQLNKIHIEKYVEEFSKAVFDMQDTKMILFPEMTMTGFSMNVEQTADIGEENIQFCRELSDRYDVCIGFGWVKKKDLLGENHYSIVVPKEGMVSDYVKIHPFSYSGEDKFFEGGDRLSICDINDFCVGTAICYDLRFPEIFQAMSKHAELIIVPANWPEKRRVHWMTLLAARAIENQCYVAGVNCCGEIGGINYSGESALYSPTGENIDWDVVLQLKFEDKDNGLNKLLICKIENNVAEVRETFPVKKDRREDLYSKL